MPPPNGRKIRGGMMHRTHLSGVAVVMVMAAACGRSDADKKAEEATKQIQQGAQQAAQGAAQAAQGAQAGQAGSNQMAQGLQQMAAGLQQMGKSGAKPVDYELLKTMIPEVTGWTRGDVKGEQQSAMGVTVAQARASFRKDDSRIELVVTDTTFSQLLLGPVSMMLAAGFEERNDDGYKRAVQIRSFPGYEDWNRKSKRGEVGAIVGNRFMVQATGHDVDSIEVVRRAVETVDLGKLAQMK